MVILIRQYTGAFLLQAGFGESPEGLEYQTETGLRFCLTLRNKEILKWGEKHLSPRWYGDLRIALNAADVRILVCVAKGKADVQKSVFPCRGRVMPAGNEAVSRVMASIEDRLAEILPILEDGCRRLRQAGAVASHKVREIALGNSRLVITELPCANFTLGWFPEPGDVLLALLAGARYFNLKIQLYRKEFLLSEREIEGVVDHGHQGLMGHYGGITRDLLHEAVLQARVRTPETTAALVSSIN